MRALVLAAGLVTAASPALAQLMLPGALHAKPPGGPDRTGSGEGSPGGSAPARPKLAVQKAPDEGSITGRDLAREGLSGLLAFEAGPDKALRIRSLSIEGEQISHPGELCQVDVFAAAIETKFAGRRRGLSRYEVAVEACPFSFEVLDGAVLVTRAPESCEFVAADCRVDPTGLWGPRGDAIDERETKQLERARAQSETNMRTNFRALLASAGKDKEAVKRIAAEQAGFSSERTMICRDYAREEVHGFCALKITQARVLDLQAQYEERAGEKPPKATAEKKPAPLRGARSQATTPPPPGAGPSP